MDARPATTFSERLTAYWCANVRWRGSSLALIGVVLLGLSFRLGALRLPFDRDEGAYGTIGRGLLDGLVPYRDLFDHKPPVIYSFYAVAASLGADEVLAVRAMSAAVFAACIVLVFAIGRRAYGDRAGVVAALAFALIGNDFTVEAARANTEQVMLLPLLLSLYCYVRAVQTQSEAPEANNQGAASSAPTLLLAAGLFAGLAVLTKPVAAWPLSVLLVHALFPNPALSGAQARPLLWRAGRACAVLAGAAMPIAAACGYFAANGALGEFYVSVVTFNSEYVRYFWSNGYRDQVTDLSPLASPYAMLAFGAAFVGFMLPRERWGMHLLLVTWTAANIVGAKTGVRTFGHYFVPALPGIALLSAAFVEALITSARQGDSQGSPNASAARRPAAAAWIRYAPAAMAVVIAAGWQARENVSFYFMSSPDEQVQREFGSQGTMVFAEAETVAGYVRERTAPGEEILVLGAEPEVYFLADRPAASRFVYGLGMAFASNSITSMQADLRRAQPAVVVAPSQNAGDAGLLLELGYARTFRAGGLDVYERAEASDVAGAATGP